MARRALPTAALGLVARASGGFDRLLPARPGLVAPIYHRVGARSPSPVDLPLEDFRHQLGVIASAGAVTWADGMSGNAGVAVTFDDGTADWVDTVLPALDEFGVPAIFYVASAFVDDRRDFPDEGRPISWSSLRDLASHPLVTIGSHTHRHRVLSTVDAGTAMDELDRSIDRIESELGRPCEHFAYPRAVLGSAAAETAVRRRFMSAAVAGGGANPDPLDPYRVVRVPITRRDSEHVVRAKLAGRAGMAEGRLRERRDRWRERRRPAVSV